MELFFPSEITSGSHVDSQTASCQRLSVGLYLHSRHVMNEFVKNLTQFRETGQITNLLRIHLVERLPAELFFLFETTKDILRDVSKLSKRV